MESTLWEIRQKVKNGEPLTDAEKAKVGLWDMQLKGVGKEIFTPEIKEGLRRALDAYRKKKNLWNSQRAFFHKEIGFDFDFEKVLDFLIEKAHVGGGTVGEFLGLSDNDTESLFDLWSGLYPEYKRQERERLLQEYRKTTPHPPTSTGAKEPTRKQKKALDSLVKHLDSGHKLEYSKELAAKDAGYTGTRQVHNLYKDVEVGVLKHESLIETINKTKESISG